jgi:hypothetical protein
MQRFREQMGMRIQVVFDEVRACFVYDAQPIGFPSEHYGDGTTPDQAGEQRPSASAADLGFIEPADPDPRRDGNSQGDA